MSEHDVFDRVLAAVHAATLDETRWPATSALIDEACGLTGNGLMVGEGPTNDVRALFVGLYYRGQRRDDLEREYLTTYHPIDERVPRFRHLPARRLVHITDLFTAEELKTSRTYNEILRRAGMQDGLNIQLPWLAGSHIGWGLNDPVDAAGWGSSRITMVERLLPHIQQFVRVRQVLAGAGALGASLADLLATTGLGIIQVDGRGRARRTAGGKPRDGVPRIFFRNSRQTPPYGGREDRAPVCNIQWDFVGQNQRAGGGANDGA